MANGEGTLDGVPPNEVVADSWLERASKHFGGRRASGSEQLVTKATFGESLGINYRHEHDVIVASPSTNIITTFLPSFLRISPTKVVPFVSSYEYHSYANLKLSLPCSQIAIEKVLTASGVSYS